MEDDATARDLDSIQAGGWNIFDAEPHSRHIEKSKQLKRNAAMIGVAEAAETAGAKVTWLAKAIAIAELQDRLIPIVGHFGTESTVGAAISTNKETTRFLLECAGVPAPRGLVVESIDEALSFADNAGRPIVVKPIGTSGGVGVSVDVATPEEIAEAFEEASEYGPKVLVEEYIVGPEYRAHATIDHCVSVYRRHLPNVVGDGKLTVGELVDDKNKLRKLNPTTEKFPIRRDSVACEELEKQGLTWSDIPAEGAVVTLRSVNGLSSGGDTEGCFQSAPESVKATAVAAVSAIPGMSWGGVYIILEESTGIPFVIEVNTNAGFNGAVFPTHGKPVEILEDFWSHLWEDAAPTPLGKPTVPLRNRSFPAVDPDAASGATTVSLRGLFTDWIDNQGIPITRYGPSVWVATFADGSEHWFAGCTTVGDSARLRRFLRRPSLVYSRLTDCDIPVVPVKKIRTVSDLNHLLTEWNTDINITPLNPRRKDDRSGLIVSGGPVSSQMLSGHRTWLAQQITPGIRLRIIATQDGGLAVLTSPDSMSVSAGTIRKATHIAVTAIRCIPQLAWGVVDVVVTGGTWLTKSRILVEGLTQNPVFASSDRVAAGSMAAVFEMLLELSDSKRLRPSYAAA